MNEALWLGEIILGTYCILWAGRRHLGSLIDLLPLLPIAMNLQVTKMIVLCGQAVPSGDMLAVMYGLGLNVVAHHKGNELATHVLNRSLLAMGAWSVITLAHVAFSPLPEHAISEAHQLIFMQTPWICLVSWLSFYLAQKTERFVFSMLIKRQSFLRANAVSTLLSQTLDTVLFTLMGLYHLQINLLTVIAWSLFIKTLAWIISNAGVHIFYENKPTQRISL